LACRFKFKSINKIISTTHDTERYAKNDRLNLIQLHYRVVGMT